MKARRFSMKFFVNILIISSVVFLIGRQAKCQSATVRFRVLLDELSSETSPGGGGDRGLCAISSLEAKTLDHERYKLSDVVEVVVTISGGKLAAPIKLVLIKSTSGYYTGSQSNLPAGVELTFLAEAKNSAEEVLMKGDTKAILEADKITDIVLTLYAEYDDLHIPVIQ